MPKVSLTCQQCGGNFERFPSYAHAKFCSRACTDAGRSAGIIGTKHRHGENLTCEVCGENFYRKPWMVKNGKSRFCSEPCRLRAHELRMVDKTAPRPYNLRGAMIVCCVCGKERYRKRSMISRNINKTCGEQECVSAYSRSLWGLAPRDPEVVRLPRPERKARKTNFTAAQRRKWLGSECARCGVTENLMLDHVTPVCAGGLSTKENSQTLCGPCNNWKAKHIDRPLARQQTSLGGCKS